MTEEVQELLESANLLSGSDRRIAISKALHRLGEVDPEQRYPDGFSAAVDHLMQVAPVSLEAEAENAAQLLFR